jgi:hypothetical protein
VHLTDFHVFGVRVIALPGSPDDVFVAKADATIWVAGGRVG